MVNIHPLLPSLLRISPDIQETHGICLPTRANPLTPTTGNTRALEAALNFRATNGENEEENKASTEGVGGGDNTKCAIHLSCKRGSGTHVHNVQSAVVLAGLALLVAIVELCHGVARSGQDAGRDSGLEWEAQRLAGRGGGGVVAQHGIALRGARGQRRGEPQGQAERQGAGARPPSASRHGTTHAHAKANRNARAGPAAATVSSERKRGRVEALDRHTTDITGAPPPPPRPAPPVIAIPVALPSLLPPYPGPLCFPPPGSPCPGAASSLPLCS